MRGYFKNQFPINNIGKDILSGIIVALVSIPISMGYAQVAGLPPVYGLYGSLLPIIVYAFVSSSRQFVVGVDAMPAAMVRTGTCQVREWCCPIPPRFFFRKPPKCA